LLPKQWAKHVSIVVINHLGGKKTSKTANWAKSVLYYQGTTTSLLCTSSWMVVQGNQQKIQWVNKKKPPTTTIKKGNSYKPNLGRLLVVLTQVDIQNHCSLMSGRMGDILNRHQLAVIDVFVLVHLILLRDTI